MAHAVMEFVCSNEQATPMQAAVFVAFVVAALVADLYLCVLVTQWGKKDYKAEREEARREEFHRKLARMRLRPASDFALEP